MSRRLRVALLAGGRSSEHDISLASARSVLEALDPSRYEVVQVAIDRDGRWEIGDAPVAVATAQSEVSREATGPAEPRLGPGPVTEGSRARTSPAETLPVPAAAGTLASLG
ncbi:MAG TPA: hypothetical protein VFI01_08810, partial [Gaiellaceae bacterium]|nr:hypothetical protein [Gaiellaceae bacterium]